MRTEKKLREFYALYDVVNKFQHYSELHDETASIFEQLAKDEHISGDPVLVEQCKARIEGDKQRRDEYIVDRDALLKEIVLEYSDQVKDNPAFMEKFGWAFERFS